MEEIKLEIMLKAKQSIELKIIEVHHRLNNLKDGLVMQNKEIREECTAQGHKYGDITLQTLPHGPEVQKKHYGGMGCGDIPDYEPEYYQPTKEYYVRVCNVCNYEQKKEKLKETTWTSK